MNISQFKKTEQYENLTLGLDFNTICKKFMPSSDLRMEFSFFFVNLNSTNSFFFLLILT